MKKRSIGTVCAIGVFAMLFASGCSSEEERREAEVIRSLEENFALDPQQGQPQRQTGTQGQTTTQQQRTTSGGTTTQGQTSAPTTTTSGGQTTTSPGGSGTSAAPQGDTAQMQVHPELRSAAQQVVNSMQTRQYASAVAALDRLMAEPNLTPHQRIAVRNSMAEIQARMINDPNFTDAERRRVQEVLDRARAR